MTVDYSNLPSGAQLETLETAGEVRSAPARVPTPTHLVLPLQMVEGPSGDMVLATYVQDTLEEVTQSVAVLLSTVTGERYQDAPDYGISQLITANPVTLAEAATAVAQFEPRASVKFSADPVAADGTQAVRVTVSLAEGGADVTPDLDR
jgi:phage baseplate assembly protein W